MIETSRIELQRFPDFGKELRRPFEVHEICYDCAEFYGPGHGERGCDAWPANRPIKTPDGKHLLCLDFNRLPDVMPGEPTGQVFPPSRMNGRKTPRERTSKPTITPAALKVSVPTVAIREIDPKRQCACGRHLPKRRRYCDDCRERRKREATARFKKTHRGRPHRALDRPTVAAGRP